MENLKSPNAKPVLPSQHTLGVCVAPQRIQAAISPAAGEPNKDDFSKRSSNWEHQTPVPNLPRKLGELTPPPFTTPK